MKSEEPYEKADFDFQAPPKRLGLLTYGLEGRYSDPIELRGHIIERQGNLQLTYE